MTQRPQRLGLALLLAACSTPRSEDSGVVRLVDVFATATVEGTTTEGAPSEPTQWIFADGEQPAFTAGHGIEDLRVEGGGLVGRAATSVPILHAERGEGLDRDDILHEIVVRARVSQGGNLSLRFIGQEEVDFERAAEGADDFPWPLTTPLIPGDEVRSYTISATKAGSGAITNASTRHVLLRPTDVAGAEFAIESLQLVFRREHLATVPAGVSWQGLADVYRETLVTRAPETAAFSLLVPDTSIFDLAVGTPGDVPVTFRVTANDEVLLERTVTTPNRWEEVVLPLDELAGEQVALELSLLSDTPGAIGFWGAPALRRRAKVSAESPRGVVLILLDTLRRDHLDAYGYERKTAPAVARLASEGTLFADAIAQGAWTKVSVPSMLSSTYPTSNGIHELSDQLSASADTIAESFRAAGYATWWAAGNGFSGKATNLHQGVEVLHEQSSLDFPEGQSSAKSARMLTDRLLPWLDAHHEVPFFVFYHALDPHSPYEPYRPYDTLWGAPDGKEAHEARVEKVRPHIESGFMKPMGLPLRSELVAAGIDPDEFVDHEIDWYDGSVRAADAEIHRILEKLDSLGLTDDTLVVFFSDHGEEFLDHGGHFHEENLYGEMVNVPLVMRWPKRISPGQIVDATVQMLNLAPTVLDLAGIAPGERMQGASLVPLLDDPSLTIRRPAVSEWKRRTDQLDEPIVDAFSIISEGYKLIHNVERPEGIPEFELYDHRADPLDQTDLAADNPEIVERLKTQLDAWHQFAVASALPSDAEAIEGLDSEELERLRSLGYVK